jgi:ketosteroid isomerase-like protein
VNEVRTIKEMVRGITAAWRDGRLDDLHRFYRTDVVFVHPGFGGRVEGGDPCVASYREFLATATVHEYHEGEPTIDIFDDAAVAVTSFTIDYELQGARHHEKGHDVLILTRNEGGWRVAWRTLVPEPPAP